MTEQQIIDILPYFSNPIAYDGKYRCELIILKDAYDYRQEVKCGIMIYDFNSFLDELNKQFQENEDLKRGGISMKQLEYTLKKKNSILAHEIVSTDLMYRQSKDECLTQLFFKFVSLVSELATYRALQLKDHGPIR